MMFDYIKRKYIEQKMYHEAFENDASYDEKNPMAKWDSGLWIRYKLFENVLASIPSADVIEPKCGEWIDENGDYVPFDNDGNPSRSCWCKECGEWLVGSDEYPVKGNFCPNCGAYMKGADNDLL